MSTLFVVSVIGVIVLLPLHFWSVEHKKLNKRFGDEKGKKVGVALGVISGWGYFLFLFGIWLSPQDRFVVPFLDDSIFIFPVTDVILLTIPVVHLVISTIFIIPGIWFGIKGVMDLGLEASEKHRSDQVIDNGSYSIVRHPQYLGAILSHIGISILLSALWAFLVTPVIIIRDTIVCRKEEGEMVNEFEEEYSEYIRRVPMLFPRFRSKRDTSE